MPRSRTPPAVDHEGQWGISIYPNARDFAFTLVHDADSAYSRRLSPLFEVFDSLGMKLTVTAFAFWADWADDGGVWRRWNASGDPEVRYRAPKAVPLVDPLELEFYKRLAATGHEIGLHTPSDTSDSRERVIEAFEYFQRVFGYYPPVYAEHSSATNKDAQRNEGANPRSIYFTTDILNNYKPWVWVDIHEALFNGGFQDSCWIPPTGSPVNTTALERYGITKAFVRTGKWKNAGGTGFLEWYSESTIDALEQGNGIALVYTHLDSDWLDLTSKRMRRPLEDRLRYLASKNGWFVPASKILDRFVAVRALRLVCDETTVRITNCGREPIDELTLVAPAAQGLIANGRVLEPNNTRKIVVGTVGAGETVSFSVHA